MSESDSDDDGDDGDSNGSNGDSRGGSDNNDNDNDDEDGSGSGSSSTGAIAGGVVGGVAGLALIGGLAWFFLRRKSAVNDQPKELLGESVQPVYGGEQDHKSQASTPPPPTATTPYTGFPVSELQGASHPHEFHAELDGSGYPDSYDYNHSGFQRQ